MRIVSLAWSNNHEIESSVDFFFINPYHNAVHRSGQNLSNKWGEPNDEQKNILFQFGIELLNIEPAIWRRIQVPRDYSFWDLHVAIQDAMGWLDYHLHEFRGRKYPLCVDGKRACPPEDCGGFRGYYDLLEIVKNPEHPRYDQKAEWLKGHIGNYWPYYPDFFDPGAVSFDNPKKRFKKVSLF